MKKHSINYVLIIIIFIISLFILSLFLPMFVYAEESVGNSNTFSDARIIISQCIVENDGLKPNEKNKVTLRLKNTNTNYPVMSVLVTGQWVSDNIPVSFDVSNQTFVGNIEAGAEADAIFYINTGDINYTSAQNVECFLTISYTLDGKKESVNTLNAIIPVYDDQKNLGEGESVAPVDVSKNENTSKVRFRAIAYLVVFFICIIGSGYIFLKNKMWG